MPRHPLYLHFPRHICIALSEAPGLRLPNTFWVQSRVLRWDEHFPSSSQLTERPRSRSPAALCHPWPKTPCAPGAGAGAELRRQPQMLVLGTAGAPARPEGPLACLHAPTRMGMAPRCCTEPTFERKASNLILRTPSIAFSPPRMQTAVLWCCLCSTLEPAWLWMGAAVVPGVRWLLALLVWGSLNRLLVLLKLSLLNSLHIILSLCFFSLHFATGAGCFPHVSKASRGALIIAVLLEQRVTDPETAPHWGSAPAVPSSSPGSSRSHFCLIPGGLRAAAAGCTRAVAQPWGLVCSQAIKAICKYSPVRGWLCPLLSAEMGARSQRGAGELLEAVGGDQGSVPPALLGSAGRTPAPAACRGICCWRDAVLVLRKSRASVWQLQK